MTYLGSTITAKGVCPIANFKQAFKSTYLYGSYSPIDGDAFVYEMEQVNCGVFEKYLRELSKHRPKQYKIVVIDNAGFHSTKNINIPENIHLLRIPPYSPELNPCEQIWKYIKARYKNTAFESIEHLKQWLYLFVNSMDKELVKSIISNHHYKKAFMRINYK